MALPAASYNWPNISPVLLEREVEVKCEDTQTCLIRGQGNNKVKKKTRQRSTYQCPVSCGLFPSSELDRHLPKL